MASHSEIFESIPEGIYTIDKNFRITSFNKTAEIITGLKKEDVIGKYCKSKLNSDICELFCPVAKILETGKSIFDYESVIRCGNGKTIPIRLNASLLKSTINEPIGAIITFRDMSLYKSVVVYTEEDVQYHKMVGVSKSMQDLFGLIDEISGSDATVLIQGETGTGKELVADAIHATSKRKDKKYVKVNCSVLQPHLLASELFGHAKGAFTDAIKDRAGRFEYADGGTIFLDEIGDISVETQLQLLRVLQEGVFERLGESISRKVNVRVIAATNRNIEKAITEGTFRKDLFYRLNVIPIEVMPLRKRLEDIPSLVKYFVKKFASVYNKNLTEVDDKTLSILSKWNWPGNVRELENVIEYSVVRSKSSNTICACNLPPYIRKEVECPKEDCIPPAGNTITAAQLLKMLEKHNWNKTKVADALGVNRSTVWRKMKSLGLN